MSGKIDRNTYLTANIGDFPEEIVVCGRRYVKKDDHRYGTNPHQPAAFYRPADDHGAIMDLEVLKTGKNGLSQTNLEDISGALNIVKYFAEPACAVMKHVNPSGAAVGLPGETLRQVFIKARDCDARAAFGSVIAFNRKVDKDTAAAIMELFAECVVAPDFDADALEVFNDSVTYKVNKQLRVLKCGALDTLPKFVGDPAVNTIKVLAAARSWSPPRSSRTSAPSPTSPPPPARTRRAARRSPPWSRPTSRRKTCSRRGTSTSPCARTAS